jgi:hypothetical protein
MASRKQDEAMHSRRKRAMCDMPRFHNICYNVTRPGTKERVARRISEGYIAAMILIVELV